MYVDHYKSGTGTTNSGLRNEEAAIVRADAAKLGANAHIIYTGDLNMPPGEAGYNTLTASGVGQAFDPLNGANSLSALTDSSTSLKYRDDYELLTAPMFSDPTGLEFVAGSYTAFGNNGVSHSATLSELQTASDHLPVFADYSYVVAAVPEASSSLLLGVAGALLGLLRWRNPPRDLHSR
jgi:endonuclease/exonuclease/phosphatase family metal-dependent hydrolase